MAKRKKKNKSAKEAPKKHEVPGGFWKQVFALTMILIAVLLVMAAFGSGGDVLGAVFAGGQDLIGFVPMLMLAMLMVTSSVLIFREPDHKLPVSMWVTTVLLLFCMTGLFGLPAIDSTDKTGGIVGQFAAESAVGLAGVWGAAIVYAIASFILLLFIFAKTPMDFFRWVGKRLKPTHRAEDAENARVIRSEEPMAAGLENLKINAGVKLVGSKKDKNADKAEPVVKKDKALVSVADPNWQLPGVALLDEQKGAADPGNIRENTLIIKDTLAQFDIDVTPDGANVGPRVTQYTMTPSSGVKLARIRSLDNELTRALSADKIRIEAPIRGTKLVGVEIPNVRQADVGFREMMESDTWLTAKGELPFAVGKDISGQPVVTDLTKMPHVLIAGTTGSGKSVMMNTLLLSLLYRNTPADMRLILIDPKQVEMVSYADIRHLITPIVTDVTGAMSALEWAVKEMESRYRTFSKEKVKSIREYNEQVAAGEIKVTIEDEDGNEQRHDGGKMPYVVIVIDEMADLMMQAGKELEARIVRVAQKGRAAGMHLVLATQRPEVKVITGLIKANIPGRIAFAVSSYMDSQIMGVKGAEKLLGRGDMLLLTTDMMGESKRIQGAMATEKHGANKGDIERVTSFLREQGPTDYNDDVANQHVAIKGLIGTGGGGDVDLDSIPGFDANDPLVRKAVELGLANGGKYGASQLQNRFSVGHGKVTKIALGLEAMGVVGPANGTKPREMNIGSMEEFDEILVAWNETH